MPLDTHHINFQCDADDKGFNGFFHKNSQFNLVSLCKLCHIKVHNKEITIVGYIDTTKGKRLEVKETW
jgi:DNA mismatch repair protein MutS